MKVYKNEGETPLERLGRLRSEEPKYKDSVLSYAGRLDPMAEGELLVLVDDENNDREKYLNLDKEYEVDILFGLSTDTGDVLGKINPSYLPFSREDKYWTLLEKGGRGRILNSFVGDISLPYPQYSSKTVKGRPLHWWARNKKIEEIEIPTKESFIYDIKLIDEYNLTSDDLLGQAISRIRMVNGDFRQEEIIENWKSSLKARNIDLDIWKIKVKCSSGTYMRSLAEAIGQKRGTTAIAWKIKRTMVY